MGDTYFDFKCSVCGNGFETIVRKPMSWSIILRIILFNLHLRFPEKQYFSCKDDICPLLDTHWDYFKPGVERSANWKNTVSGAFSSNPSHFESGSLIMKHPGYWALKNREPPPRYKPGKPKKTRIKSEGDASDKSTSFIKIEPTTSVNSPSNFIEGLQKLLHNSTGFGQNIPLASLSQLPSVTKAGSWDALDLSKNQALPTVLFPPPNRVSSGDMNDTIDSLKKLFENNINTTNAMNLDDKQTIQKPVESKPKKRKYTKKVKVETGNSNLIEANSNKSVINDLSKLSSTDIQIEEKQLPQTVGKDLNAGKESPTLKKNKVDISVNSKDRSDGDESIRAQAITYQEDQIMKVVKEELNLTSNHTDSLVKDIDSNFGNSVATGELLQLVENNENHSDDNIFSDESDELPPVSLPESSTVLKPTQLDLENLDKDAQPKLKKPKITPITVQQEFDLMSKLDLMSSLPTEFYQLRRKLHLRALKRSKNIKLFDLDTWMNRYMRPSQPLPLPMPIPSSLITQVQLPNGSIVELKLPGKKPKEVFEKFQNSRNIIATPYKKSFLSRLLGDPFLSNTLTSQEPFASPFTGRLLPSYIARDYDSNPLRKILLESIAQHNDSQITVKYPIDYVHFQDFHLQQVNDMLRRIFWDDIDVSESLLTPDYTVVALYKRLVVGGCFMTPDGYITYLFVTPGWEGAGIASFMLHLLIQKALASSLDVTLHVSANNPVMLVYQSFGFKAEEFNVGFYDKYLPPDSRACKNALFCRLRLRTEFMKRANFVNS
ncbi:hypothetical protein BC833DRAFT_612704 [Globomyces pollinis-pini]|nr:hypothetical protein BC833DRAFT_612704 [Globomyces pollinis-pini]